jgi:Na+-transporting methylmalonyl-CoA/oxaloacetate decarboxylase gamma subunit
MNETFIISLKILVFGMAGIFVFMLLFWVVIVALQKFFPKEENPSDGKAS